VRCNHLAVTETCSKNKSKKRLPVLFILLWEDTECKRNDLGFAIKRHCNKQRAIIVMHPTAIDADENRSMDPEFLSSSMREDSAVVEAIRTINHLDVEAADGTAGFDLGNKSKERFNQF